MRETAEIHVENIVKSLNGIGGESDANLRITGNNNDTNRASDGVWAQRLGKETIRGEIDASYTTDNYSTRYHTLRRVYYFWLFERKLLGFTLCLVSFRFFL